MINSHRAACSSAGCHAPIQTAIVTKSSSNRALRMTASSAER